MALPDKNGWYVVKKLHGSTDAARLAEMGVVPGARVWLGVQGMPMGILYIRTQDGAMVVRKQELAGIEFLLLEPHLVRP
jgi:Fe2+ transport system protein FeoA